VFLRGHCQQNILAAGAAGAAAVAAAGAAAMCYEDVKVLAFEIVIQSTASLTSGPARLLSARLRCISFAVLFLLTTTVQLPISPVQMHCQQALIAAAAAGGTAAFCYEAAN
jgi:hypothetical protein